MINHVKPHRRYDVAKKAGVSEVTVTYALSDSKRIRMSETTRQRIRRIASELGYRPDYLQKARIAGKTFTIGLLQPKPDALFNLFYQHVVHGLVTALNEDGFDLLTLFRSGENRGLNLARQGRLDGMMVLQSDMDNTAICALAATGIPLVLINRALPDDCAGRVACIHHDNRSMMRAAVDSIVKAGCTRLFYINTADCFADQEMLSAFTAAMQGAAAQGVIGSHILPSRSAFREQAKTLLPTLSRQDAVITDGQYFTDTLVQAGRDLGLEPGREYHLVTAAICAEDCSATRVEALCFCQDPESMGSRAWALLKRVIGGEDTPRTELLPYISSTGGR